MKKKLKKLEKYQGLFEDLKAKENERQQIEIAEKIQMELKRQKESKSFFGHLKIIKSKHH